MKGWQTNHTATCFAEITFEALKLHHKEQALQLPLTRRIDGRLEPACKEAVTGELRKFLHTSVLHPRVHVICAVSARGLSLRRLTLPATGEDEHRRLLQLQVENEFPLAPDELAWGSAKLNGLPEAAAENRQQRVLVAAVKKDSLQEYREIFVACGAVPVFVPAALARVLLCPELRGRLGHIEIGPRYSELVLLEDGSPVALRTISWGSLQLVKAVPAQGPAATAAQSEGKPSALSAGVGIPEVTPVMSSGGEDPLTREAHSLAGLVRNGAPLQVLCVSGLGRENVEFARALGQELGAICQPLEPGGDRSTAIAGMVKAAAQNVPLLQLKLAGESSKGAPVETRRASLKWAAAAVALSLLAISFPYLEALVFKPGLAKKLAALKADRGRLVAIDSELEFLRYYKQSQPPYLDAIYMIARALPAGSRFDNVSMARRGELSLRGSLRDANQVADFRSKLLDSGLFSSIAVEEQTPTPDRQKLIVRITAQWKTDQSVRDAAGLAAAKEPERPKNAMGGMPGGMMPGGMPSFPGPMGPPGMAAGGMPMPAGIAVGEGAVPRTGTIIRSSPGMPSSARPINPTMVNPASTGGSVQPVPGPVPQESMPNPSPVPQP